MRLLFVVSQLGLGGTEGELRWLAGAVERRASHDTEVFSLAKHRPGDLLADGVPASFGGRTFPYDPLPVARLASCFRRFRPQRVAAFDRHAFLYSLAARWLSRLDSPIVARSLETPGLVTASADLQLRWASRHLMPDDRLAVLSHALADFVCTRWRFPPRQVVVVPLGIDVDRFSPGAIAGLRTPARRALGLADSDRVIVQIANLSPNKHHESSFRVLARIATAGIANCRLLVVGGGDGGRMDALRRSARDEGVDPRVVFVGPQTDVRPYLAAADVLILTSKTEATPTVVLEALACRLPVVVTSYLSAREQLGEELEYLVVPQGDEERFADLVTRLLRSEAERRGIGETGRARLLRQFTHTHAMSAWESVLCS